MSGGPKVPGPKVPGSESSRTSARAAWRRLALGLPTVLGLRRGGYFIPYRYLAGAPDEDRREISWIADLFRRAEADFSELLDLADRYSEDLIGFRGAVPPLPRWEQGWFPRLDGVAAYCLTRGRAPRRIVEIGSGHSTRFFAAGLAARGDGEGTIIAIDPAPRADIATIPSVDLRRGLLQDMDTTLFEALEPGDFLAIDSSHIAMPGSDVDMLVSRILPRLKSGILVQIHDIFLPDPYPRDWGWRGYNEQTSVAALLAGGGWRPVWSSRYVATRMRAQVEGSAVGRLPLFDNAWESALWLEKL